MLNHLKYTIYLFATLLLLCTTDLHSADQEQLDRHVKFLSDNLLEGRYPGTPGNIQAAEYIRERFKEYGLEPLGENYYDYFDLVTDLKLGDKNEAYIETVIQKPGVPKEMLKPIRKQWKLGKDWHPIRFSSNEIVSGELVFVGYGISSDELKYDDYEGMDVEDKIVIILSDSSETSPKNKDFFGRYSSLGYKATNARNHGAKGIIFIKTMSDSANTWYPFEPERIYTNSGIVAIQANRQSIARFFPRTKPMLDLEKEITATKKPQSIEIPNANISLAVDVQEVIEKVPNVIGYVEGKNSDLENEYLVVGAHFDHLGWGSYNSRYNGKKPMIHNGADDNSSGTAAMIELANAISKRPLKRPVIFMGFNAEEMGLLGSADYVKEPLIPMDQTVFMLNLDMVGRMKENKVSILGTGTSSNFVNMIDSLAKIDSLAPSMVKEGFGPSDHASFYSKEIPVIMIFTDLHTDYHKPTDDYEKINFDGLSEVTDFSENIVRTIGNMDNKPDYLVVKSSDSSGKAKRKMGHGAWFGIIPNFEEQPKGMKISGVSAGSPAQKAGLQANDVIISFDGKDIKNLYELTFILKEKHPGDELEVVVIRNENEKTFKVTLAKRN